MPEPTPGDQPTEEAPDTVESFKERVRGSDKGAFLGMQKKRDPFREAVAETAPETETPAPTGNGDGEVAPKKAPDSAPAEQAEPTKGEEQKPKDGGEAPAEDEAVLSLLQKYGSATKVAEAYLHLQGMFSKKEADAQTERDQLRSFLNDHFEIDAAGQLALRPEAAARRLAAERPKAVAQAADEKSIRANVEAEFKKYGEEHTDDPEAFLQTSKGLIDSQVKKEVDAAKKEAKEQHLAEELDIARISDRFFRANPDAQKYLDPMDAWLEPMPEDLQKRLLREHPRILERIYAAEKLAAEFRPAIIEAYRKGREVEKSSVKPTADAGSPQGQQGPSRSLGPDDGSFKGKVLRAGRRGVMDTLVGGRK